MKKSILIAICLIGLQGLVQADGTSKPNSYKAAIKNELSTQKNKTATLEQANDTLQIDRTYLIPAKKSNVITVRDWRDLPKGLKKGTEIKWIPSQDSQSKHSTIYILEEENITTQERVLKLAQKKSISWMGRELLTVHIHSKTIPYYMITKIEEYKYEYYDRVQWSSMAALAVACITALSWLHS